ncbi:hypothetical protein BJ742DRAFT_744276 [Cladochytrium replicatum]|nr:hypothetical protein BJ742DRAFT_744276 [Cladochytrium replicatum]
MPVQTWRLCIHRHPVYRADHVEKLEINLEGEDELDAAMARFVVAVAAKRCSLTGADMEQDERTAISWGQNLAREASVALLFPLLYRNRTRFPLLVPDAKKIYSVDHKRTIVAHGVLMMATPWDIQEAIEATWSGEFAERMEVDGERSESDPEQIKFFVCQRAGVVIQQNTPQQSAAKHWLVGRRLEIAHLGRRAFEIMRQETYPTSLGTTHPIPMTPEEWNGDIWGTRPISLLECSKKGSKKVIQHRLMKIHDRFPEVLPGLRAHPQRTAENTSKDPLYVIRMALEEAWRRKVPLLVWALGTRCEDDV